MHALYNLEGLSRRGLGKCQMDLMIHFCITTCPVMWYKLFGAAQLVTPVFSKTSSQANSVVTESGLLLDVIMPS